MQSITLKIEGMTCAACSARVERVTQMLDGVKTSSVNLVTEKLNISFDESIVSVENIKSAVEKAGYKALDIQKKTTIDEDKIRKEKAVKLLWTKFIISAVFSIPLLYIAMGPMIGLPIIKSLEPMENPLTYAVTQLILTIPAIAAGYKFYTIGFSNIVKKSPNMDSLIAMGTASAFIYSCYSLSEIIKGNHHAVESMYFETVGVIITLILLRKIIGSSIKRENI